MIICPICIEDFETDEEDKQIVSIKCGHVFHKKCIYKWYEININPLPDHPYISTLVNILQCPICKTRHKHVKFQQIFLSIHTSMSDKDKDESSILKLELENARLKQALKIRNQQLFAEREVNQKLKMKLKLKKQNKQDVLLTTSVVPILTKYQTDSVDDSLDNSWPSFSNFDGETEDVQNNFHYKLRPRKPNIFEYMGHTFGIPN